MSKFFVKDSQVGIDRIVINNEDVNHISNVLRMRVGDELCVCDMDTSVNYNVVIEDINKSEVICRIIEELPSRAESNVEVCVYQGLPKADKMELIIQKSVELGVKEIVPVEMKRCVVRLNDKEKVKKVERWNKIAEVAAKQSGRDIIPKICGVQSLQKVVEDFGYYDLILLCYENEKDVFLKDVLSKYKDFENIKIAVIIGPEGGIDSKEVMYLQDSGAKVISLGNRILRTETVALSMLSIIMYEFERNEL